MEPVQEQEQSNQTQSTSSSNTVTGLFPVIVVVLLYHLVGALKGDKYILAIQDN